MPAMWIPESVDALALPVTAADLGFVAEPGVAPAAATPFAAVIGCGCLGPTASQACSRHKGGNSKTQPSDTLARSLLDSATPSERPGRANVVAAERHERDCRADRADDRTRHFVLIADGRAIIVARRAAERPYSEAAAEASLQSGEPLMSHPAGDASSAAAIRASECPNGGPGWVAATLGGTAGINRCRSGCWPAAPPRAA